MKKVRVFLSMILVFAFMIICSNNVKAYTTIDSKYLFNPSTFDNLILNYKTLPTISVSGSERYEIKDGTCSSGEANRQISFPDSYRGKVLDSTITVSFTNCGTLDGKPIDMKLVYSDIITDNTGSYLYWSAFGSTMKSSNEWWYNNVEHLKIDIYFYYHGESTPINMDIAYLSIFSEDQNEGASSAITREEYVYVTTNMAYAATMPSCSGRTFNNVYYGTASGSTEAVSLNCVAFRYDNVNHMQVELYGLNNKGGIGYHLQYTPLTATLPSAPVKTVNKTESELGDTLVYTVNQKISQRYDSAFTYSSLVFKDTIDKNLTYNSLKVYNENGADITAQAGTVGYNSQTRQLTYTFNRNYLNSMPYNGQIYKFEISTKVNNTSTSATITDKASSTINNSSTLESNTVSTTLKSKVVVHYVNKQGVKIAEDTVINGNLLDRYETSAKDVYAYELVSDSGNTSGTMQKNTTEVTYVYDLIRVNINLTKTLEGTDSTQLQNLEGARFKLTVNNFASQVDLANPSREYFSTYTDKNGNCIITGVPYGNYTIVEEVVPDLAYAGNFYLNGASDVINNFSIDINKDENLTYSLEDVAKKMQITVYKEDLETGTTTQGDAHLEGAEYTIYKDKDCADAIETITIQKNEDGTYSATSGWYLSGTYYVKETKAPEGYLIDEKVYTVSQDPAAQTEEYSYHSVTSKDEVIRNSIEIVKNLEETDSTEKQSLAGAVFSATLNSDTSKVYYSEPTDERGYCIIEELPYGTYTLRESTIPDTAYNGEFYINGSDERKTTFEQFIELDDSTNDPYRYEDITDVAKKMQITVYKEDLETGTTTQGDAHLEGAEYTIYKDKDCKDAIETITIQKNEDGTYSATSGWYLVGTYYVKETKAPEGYLIDEKVYTVSQDPAEQSEEKSYHSVTSKDEVIRNSIELVKNLEETDSTEKQSLAGAVFSATLNSDTSKVYYSEPTDERGYCIIEELPYGTYTLRESTIPDTAYNGEFYINGSDERKTTFEQFIEVDDSVSEPYRYEDITDVAKKMQITIYKEDLETGTTTQGDAHLEGAEYTLYRDENCTDAIETVTIQKNEDGTYSAKSGWYLVGKYYLKETKAPEGYLIDEEVYSVEVVPSEQTEEYSYHSITSKDEVMKGAINVIKYNNNSSSTDKSPAEGAVLRLSLNSNPEKYYEATVDKNGYLEFIDNDYKDQYPYTIPYGKYTISEVEASNSGEHIFINKQQTEIVYDEQEQKYILSDEYIRMKLTIEIRDSETKKLVPGGATFKIWDVDNQKWYEEMKFPSGEYISEFTTNDQGQLTFNRHLEAGNYVIYEVKAPEGYYLEDELREGSKGYEFTVGVGENGDVKVYHDGQEQVLEYEEVIYDNIPTKMYAYTATLENVPQKAVINIEKLAEQLVGIDEKESEYGKLNTPVYELKGLNGVEFRLVAAEDIITPEGTVRYTKGQVVSNDVTKTDGKASTTQVYLGKYILEEISTPNGYIISSKPINLDIKYTDQYEKVQYLYEQVENEKQNVNLSFEKEFKELENSKFKIEEKEAIFGIYTKETMKNYKGENILGQDELIDIMVMDEENVVKNNIDIPEGKYYVKELKVSNPYELSKEQYEFDVEYVDSQNKDIELTVNNGKVTNIADTAEFELIVYPDIIWDELNIANEFNRETLEDLAEVYGIAGKTYGVYSDKECTKPVMTIEEKEATFVTDEDGIINIPDMPTGTYYLKEIIAPFGYELSEEVIKVEINADDEFVLLKAKEPLKKADLLQKTDSFTKDIIEGVKFEITDEEDELIYTGTTNKDGIVEIPIIYFENGKEYYYKEVSAPEMYDIDLEKHKFVAKYDEENCEWELDIIPVGNERKTIDEVIVRKTDAETGEPLQGCVFTIVLLDENGEEYVNENGEKIYLVKDAVTNENGEYVIKNVPYGTYKFVEVTPPEGYELDEDMTGYVFTIDENSPETVIFEVTNTGDIAVISIASVALICAVGIVFALRKNIKTSK